MTDNVQERLLATLRKLQPARVRAFTSDDDARDIAVPGGRKKWGQVISALEARAWSRVVLMDKSGAELGTVENTSVARDIEEFGPTGKATGEYAHAVRINELVLKGIREALSWRDEETKTLLKAQGEVVREMVNGMRALSEVWSEQAEVSAEVAAASAAKEAAGDGDQVKQIMEALPVIMQALPLLKSMLGAGEPAPQPNGARKGH